MTILDPFRWWFNGERLLKYYKWGSQSAPKVSRACMVKGSFNGNWIHCVCFKWPGCHFSGRLLLCCTTSVDPGSEIFPFREPLLYAAGSIFARFQNCKSHPVARTLPAFPYYRCAKDILPFTVVLKCDQNCVERVIIRVFDRLGSAWPHRFHYAVTSKTTMVSRKIYAFLGQEKPSKCTRTFNENVSTVFDDYSTQKIFII